VHRDQRPERSLAALDLLARQRLRDEVEPGSAVLLRDHDPEQPQLGHPLDHGQVEVVVDVVLDGVREHALVDDVTLDLAAGTIVGLLGRNGAGKSTLLSTLAAFRRPTSGQVRIDGEDLLIMKESDIMGVIEGGSAAKKKAA